MTRRTARDVSKRARGSGLKRELGPFTATLFTAGMMVGIGIFATLGAATEAAGSGILVAMLLGGSVALATGISAAQLGVNNPTEGGAFTWARDFDRNTLGFIAGCGYLGKNLISMSVIALAFATYLGQFIRGLPEHVSAAAGVLAITVLNLFGIQLTSRVLIGLLVAVVGLLALYAGASLHAVDPGYLTPILGDRGPLGLFAGAAIFFWTWDGFMRMAIMASEVKEPRRTIPIAVAGGVTIAAVMFVGTGAITLGVLGADEIGRQDTPLLAAAWKAMGQWGSWVILAAAILAALAEILGDLLSASRVVLPMAEARELPVWLAKIHPRSRSPRRAVVVLGLLSAGVDLVFDLRRLIEVGGSFMLVWYFITHYAALQLPRNKRLTSPIFSWYGIVGCVGLTVAMPHLAVLAAWGTLAVLTVIRFVLHRALAER
jgi:basic amino acid/polyamine antiporter, APA family